MTQTPPLPPATRSVLRNLIEEINGARGRRRLPATRTASTSRRRHGILIEVARLSLHAADQQRGAHQQHDTDGRLDGEQDAAEGKCPRRNRIAAFQPLDNVGTRHKQRRGQPERDGRCGGQQHRIRHDRGIRNHAERKESRRSRIGDDTKHDKRKLERDDDANGGCGEPKDESFNQQLPDNAASAAAEREARPDLADASGRSRQQQIPDIGAGNQPHQ